MFLIALQLASQVGIPIHKHFCEMDGVFASVFVKVDHECEDSAPKNELPPCCQAKQDINCETQTNKDDCCSDELEVVKTSLDQSRQDGFNWNLSLDLVSIPSTPTYAYDLSNLAQKQIAKQTYYRPPPLFERGRDLQTLHQVWRI